MRKESFITIDDRGEIKNFRIREMSAVKLESFILLLSNAILKSGAIQPDTDIDNTNLPALAREIIGNGLKSFRGIEESDLNEITNRILKCCDHIVDKSYFPLDIDTCDSVITDIKTLFELQKQFFILHFGFLLNGSQLNSQESQAPQISDTKAKKATKTMITRM